MLLMFLNFFNYPFFLDIQDEYLVLGHSIQKETPDPNCPCIKLQGILLQFY